MRRLYAELMPVDGFDSTVDLSDIELGLIFYLPPGLTAPDQLEEVGVPGNRFLIRGHFYSDFDRAIEDTLLALNTGYWRTRDGVAIDRSQGKAHLVNQDWRDKLDGVAGILEEIRARFRQSLGLDEMLFRWDYPPSRRMDRMLEDRFRGDFELGQWMDEKRREAIELVNSILREIGPPELRALR